MLHRELVLMEEKTIYLTQSSIVDYIFGTSLQIL